MKLILLCVVLASVGVSAVHKPMAFHYRNGLMLQVAHIRHMAVDWSKIDGLASLPDCRYVQPKHPYYVTARFWLLKSKRWSEDQTFMIVDCTNPRDLHSQTLKGIVPNGIEVDADSSRRNEFYWNGYSGAGKTRVIVGQPWR